MKLRKDIIEAAENGELEHFITLVEEGADITLPLEEGGKSILHIAEASIIEWLIKERFSEIYPLFSQPSTNGYTPLIYSAIENRDEELE